ncbi:MAG: class I SAM-dependent methyltransferase [Malacoplasma sp.]
MKSVSAILPSSDITAIDITIPKSFSTDNIVFIERSVVQLAFVLESFDLVITLLLLHHWKEKDNEISEI